LKALPTANKKVELWKQYSRHLLDRRAAAYAEGVNQDEAIKEQIQLLLGNASVHTTEHYLGCKQKVQPRVNDNLGLEDV